MRKLFSTLLMVMLFTGITFAQHHNDLKWTLSTTPNVTSQNVYRAPCTGTMTGVVNGIGTCSQVGSFSVIASVPPTATTFSDTNVVANSKFVYQVTAVCSTCSPSESSPSNQLALLTPLDGQPNPPTGLGTVTVALNNSPKGSVVTASWSDSADTSTRYTLMGSRRVLWFTLKPVVLATGVKQSTTGSYAFNYSSMYRLANVNLKVCDATECKTANN